MTEIDKNHIETITNFLNEENIEYHLNDNIEGTFILKNSELEIRYVNTFEHKMDYTKRFNIKGVPHNFFINISKSNYENNIRTIWIKDWEMEENETIYNQDGSVELNYHRKWNVLKSYIKTASGKVNNRFYARNCEIKIVNNSELRPFLTKNCFYGYRAATVNLGLYLKKDIGDVKAGTLLMVYTFGHPFYAKGKYDVEVIRVATKLNSQVIGGASKLLKHFLTNYPTISVNKKDVIVNTICFYVDADHNDGRSLQTLGFEYVSWQGAGFMNVEAATRTVFHRKPLLHKLIMERMAKGEVYSVSNAGTIVYKIEREKYLNQLNNTNESSE